MPIRSKTALSSSIATKEAVAEHAPCAKSHRSSWLGDSPIARSEIEAPNSAVKMRISTNESTPTSRRLRPKNFPVGTPSEFIHVSEFFEPDIRGVTNHTEQRQVSGVQPYGTLKQTPAANKGVDAGNDRDEKVGTESGTKRLYSLMMQMVQEVLDKGFGVDGNKVMVIRAEGRKETIRRSRSSKQIVRPNLFSRPRSRPSKNLPRRLSSHQQAAPGSDALKWNSRACIAPGTIKGKEKATPLQPLESTSVMPYGIIIGQKSNTKVPILGSKASMKLLRVQDHYVSKLPDGADELLDLFIAFEPEKNRVYFMEDPDWDEIRSYRAESLVKAMINGPANWLPVRKRSHREGKNVENTDKERYASTSSWDDVTSSDNGWTELGINFKSSLCKLEHQRHKSLTDICEPNTSPGTEIDYEMDYICDTPNKNTRKQSRRRRSNSSPECESDMERFSPYRRVLTRIGASWMSQLNQITHEDDTQSVISSVIDDEIDVNDEGKKENDQVDSFQDLSGIFFLDSDADSDSGSDEASADLDFNQTSGTMSPEESFQPSSASESLVTRTFATTRQTGGHIREVIQRLRESLAGQQVTYAEIQRGENSRRNAISRFESPVLCTQPSYISEATSVATIRENVMSKTPTEKVIEETTSTTNNDWCDNEIEESEDCMSETGTNDANDPESTCGDTGSEWGDTSMDFSQRNNLEINGDNEEARHRVFSGTSTSSNESYQYDQNWW